MGVAWTERRSDCPINFDVQTFGDSRLEQLQKPGLITRRVSRYALTQKGLDLLPAMVDLIGWSEKYDKRTAAPRAFLARIARDREGLIADISAQLRAEYDL